MTITTTSKRGRASGIVRSEENNRRPPIRERPLRVRHILLLFQATGLNSAANCWFQDFVTPTMTSMATAACATADPGCRADIFEMMRNIRHDVQLIPAYGFCATTCKNW